MEEKTLEIKEEFDEKLNNLVERISKHNIKIILGYLNGYIDT